MDTKLPTDNVMELSRVGYFYAGNECDNPSPMMDIDDAPVITMGFIRTFPGLECDDREFLASECTRLDVIVDPVALMRFFHRVFPVLWVEHHDRILELAARHREEIRDINERRGDTFKAYELQSISMFHAMTPFALAMRGTVRP